MSEPTHIAEQAKQSAISFLIMRRREPRPKEHPSSVFGQEQKIVTMISRLLRNGVLLAAAFVLLGGIIYLARHGDSVPLYTIFTGEPYQLRGLGGIVSSAFSFSGRGLILFGLLILLATPMARVAMAFVGFFMVSDLLYTLIAGLVLAILAFGFFNLPV